MRCVQAESRFLGFGWRRLCGRAGTEAYHLHKDLLPPHLFAASYLGQSVCALAAAIVLQFVKVPPLGQAPHTSAPLAMVGCGHSVTDAALGIQWHVLAMYAPSFVTGAMIARFGIERITGIGLA
jgi:hypothetical protein